MIKRPILKTTNGKRLKTIASLACSALSRNRAAVAYYNFLNFGDLLTPEVLSAFGVRSFHCPNYRFSDAIGVGSILHKLPDDYSGYILGSGSISGENQRLPKAKALLVRGHLTRQALALSDDTLVGDPGLIVDYIYSEFVGINKEWDVGIVPHYKDSESQSLRDICAMDSNLKVKVIDVRRSPREVVKDIARCNQILSSSLHGLIAADSFGIPNLWIKLSDEIIGEGFKYRDYYSCFNIDRYPREIRTDDSLDILVSESSAISPELVNIIKDNIREAYTRYQSVLSN